MRRPTRHPTRRQTIRKSGRRGRRLAGLAGALTAALGVVVLSAGPAAAHPMGNFSVNHYHGLRLFPDHVEDTAVVDAAELPTLQERGSVDRDGNGTPSDAERAAYARAQCGSLDTALAASAGGTQLRWRVSSAEFTYQPGAAGLTTSRLHCELTAPARLDRASALRLADGYRGDRVGWHEITAVGRGVRLDAPTVPRRSVTDELRRYPRDVLSSPLDVRSVDLRTEPGEDDTGGPAGRLPRVGFPDAVMATLGGKLNAFAATDRLTLPVGLLAVLAAVALGAAHAALPGHGKTVVAAYLAGRRGGVRDALVVGATVTVTHTAGVLVLGLALSLSAALVGEWLLSWLGIASGALVAVVGAALLRAARRPHDHHHDHQRDHDHHHDHDRAHDHRYAHDHDQHDHDHRDHHGHDHQAPGHPRSDGPADRSTRRRYLVGMGVAGGLVPSPSALVVLLGAIALGRTAFGVLLVLAYGAGMAATLTAVGLVLATLPRRLGRRFAGTGADTGTGAGAGIGRRAASFTHHLARAAPVGTAVLVLVVGLGLVTRSAASLI